MSDIGVSCATCDVFVANQDGKAGICRRNPPQVFIVPGPLDAQGRPIAQAKALWPVMGADDWCGQHQNFKLGLAVPMDSRLNEEARGEA